MELSGHNSVAVLTFPPEAGYPRLTMGVLAELGDLLNEVKLSGLFQGVVIAAARIATYDASFGHPGASLGLITGWGGIQRLTRLIGRAAATQLLLTGERVPATQALTLGLVDELAPSPDLVEAAARRALARTHMKGNWKLENGKW